MTEQEQKTQVRTCRVQENICQQSYANIRLNWMDVRGCAALLRTNVTPASSEHTSPIRPSAGDQTREKYSK